MMTEWRYIKHNISQSDIEAFENLSGIQLSEDIEAFLLAHNNGRPRPNQFDTNETQGRLFDKLLSFNLNDVENIFTAYEQLKSRLPSHLVALAMDPFGNYVCLDKENLNVVFWLHETGDQEKTGKQWKAWLNSLY